MFAVKNEPVPTEGALISLDLSTTQAELDLWENLSLYLDMEKDQQSSRRGSSTGNRNTTSGSRRTRSASTPSAGNSSTSVSSSLFVQVHVLIHCVHACKTSAQASASAANPPPAALLPSPHTAEGQEALARAVRALQEVYPYLNPQAGYAQPNAFHDPTHYPSHIPPQFYSQFPWPRSTLNFPHPPPHSAHPGNPGMPYGFPSGQFAMPPPVPRMEVPVQPVASTSTASQ